jgi:cytochrome c heme-lyase
LQTWAQLLVWERQLHPETADAVRLKKFSGDAKKVSPKARLRSLFGATLPFDRHDWIVVRGEGGEEARYVVDFYQGEAKGISPVAMHIDVRPAIDSFGSAMDRVRMSFRKLSGQAQRAATSRHQAASAARVDPPPNPLRRHGDSHRWASPLD